MQPDSNHKPKLSFSQEGILKAVMDYKQKHDGNAPSYCEIAQMSGYAVRDVRRFLKELDTLKVITVWGTNITVTGGRWLPPGVPGQVSSAIVAHNWQRQIATATARATAAQDTLQEALREAHHAQQACQLLHGQIEQKTKENETLKSELRLLTTGQDTHMIRRLKLENRDLKAEVARLKIELQDSNTAWLELSRRAERTPHPPKRTNGRGAGEQRRDQAAAMVQ